MTVDPIIALSGFLGALIIGIGAIAIYIHKRY
jgi:hypothetical protein